MTAVGPFVPVERPSMRRRVVALALSPFAAAGWTLLSALDVAVQAVLFRSQRPRGAVSLLWGLLFALVVWAIASALGLGRPRAVPFGLVAGAATALFVYLRGAGLESPPVERPGAFLQRRRERRRRPRTSTASRRAYAASTRELLEARLALAGGEVDVSLYALREAARVAIAQRRPSELREVGELARSLAARASGQAAETAGRIAERVDAELRSFSADALSASGIRLEPAQDILALLLDRRERRAREGAYQQPPTRELAAARAALADDDPAAALFSLEEARRVAVAQRRLDELLAVHELARFVCSRREGRTRAAGERLLRKTEDGLRDLAGSS